MPLFRTWRDSTRFRRDLPDEYNGRHFMKGYGGRILFIDVTRGTSRVEALGEENARARLGGSGLAARPLLDHVPAGTDPYDAANAVVFAVGPVTDTTVPGNTAENTSSEEHPPSLQSHHEI